MYKTYASPKSGLMNTGVPSAGAASSRIGHVVKRRGSQDREADSFLKSIMGNFGVDRYNSVHDPLQEGSVIEDWIPRDMPGIHLLMRRIYTRDDVGGPMVDIYKEMMWSDYELLDVTEEEMLRPFQESLDNIDPISLMPQITGEHLVIGRSICGLAFDPTRGIFTHVIPHSPDFVRIRPVPIFGYDPLVDLQTTASFREFVASQDPRVLNMQSSIPASALQAMEDNSGWKPLEPLTTIFVRRQTSPYDYVGTSIYTRLLSFWAIQKALIDATAVALRRRAAGVLHIKVGNERWHPSDGQIRDTAGLWMQAEEDIGGGVVATRDGVEADRSQSAVGDIWKFSDEYPFLSEGKMRALGVSDAFLSGDGSYNNMETALSSFMERMRGCRDYITNQVITRKIFHTIARVHGFIRPENNSPQGRRQAWTMPQHQAMKIPASRLIIPKLHWHKNLFPQVDEALLAVLQTLKELGLPVTNQHLAAAAGFDLKRGMEMLDEDITQHKEIAKWQKAIGGGEEIEGGGDTGIFGSVKMVPHPVQKTRTGPMRTASAKALADLNVWDRNGRFLDLSEADAQKALKRVLPLLTGSSKPPSKVILATSGLNTSEERAMFRYVLVRLGFMPGYAMDEKRLARISKHLAKSQNPKVAYQEVEIMARVCKFTSDKGGTPKNRVRHMEGDSVVLGKNSSDILRKPEGVEKVTRMPHGPDGSNMLSGIVPKVQIDY